MRTERILWFVSTLEDTHFLSEFRPHFSGQIDVFHLNFITRFHLLAHEGEHILPYYCSGMGNNGIDTNIDQCFNTLSGRLTSDEAARAYQATQSALTHYLRDKPVEGLVFMIPSGRHIHHIAAASFGLSRQIKRIYINYSNFPGYTFFDPEGTDCMAAIYRDPSILDRLAPTPVDVDAVFFHFAELKRRQKEIPQKAASPLKLRLKRFAFIIDTMLQKLTRLYGDRRIPMRKPASYRAASNPLVYEPIPPKGQPFLFFPLQVSTDQQVLINFEGGSIYTAIDAAIAHARAKGIALYVREHPAEANKQKIREFLQQKVQQGDLHVTDASVPGLIDSCTGVITINSTVGLEARINRRPVKFLGKSFYAKASDEQLAIYLSHYLSKVDYHNPKITSETAKQILKKYQIA
jgi:capsular polysaccharide export protein